MITNERQYRITKEEAQKFAIALDEEERSATQLTPLLRTAMREALESQSQELREELAEYDAVRQGKVRVIELASLRDLPEALIRARLAAGLTQKSLAERLNLKEQQVQRYEATRYAGVRWERLQAVADALGVELHEHVVMPARAGATAPDSRTGD
jgi:ribosome-binding protein aMBF1 (putative translation factor)